MRQTDILVVGAGPAGLGAAIEGARAGARVLLVDENRKAGGQLYKQIHKFFGSGAHYAGTIILKRNILFLYNLKKHLQQTTFIL